MSGFGTGSVDPFPVPEKNGLLVLGEQDEVLLADYTRHHSKQLDSVKCALEMAHEQFPDAYFHVAMTGSGAKSLAEELNISYVQEVVANSIILKLRYQEIGTAIELGGQDAKIIYFFSGEMQKNLIQLMHNPEIQYVSGGHLSTVLKVDAYVRTIRDFLSKHQGK